MMAIYRNKVTGAEFESSSICKGRDWEVVPPSPAEKMANLAALRPKPEKKDEKPAESAKRVTRSRKK